MAAVEVGHNTKGEADMTENETGDVVVPGETDKETKKAARKAVKKAGRKK